MLGGFLPNIERRHVHRGVSLLCGWSRVIRITYSIWTVFLSSEEEATRSVVLLKSLEGCLWMYRTQDWEAKLSTLRQQLDDQQSRLLMHYLVAQSMPASADTTGRLGIPPQLMEYANIKGEVVIIGLYDRLELWSPIHWEDYLLHSRISTPLSWRRL